MPPQRERRAGRAERDPRQIADAELGSVDQLTREQHDRDGRTPVRERASIAQQEVNEKDERQQLDQTGGGNCRRGGDAASANVPEQRGREQRQLPSFDVLHTEDGVERREVQPEKKKGDGREPPALDRH